MLFYDTLFLVSKCPLCLCHLHKHRMFVSLSVTVSLSVIFCMVTRQQIPNQEVNPVCLKVQSRQQRGDMMGRG